MVRFVLRNYNDGYITLEKIITINNRVYKFPYRTTRKIGEICLVKPFKEAITGKRENSGLWGYCK